MSEQQDPIDLNALRGTIAVVTGAGNNGIGWGICKHAAGRLGMHVIALDLHQNLVESAQTRLREAYPEVVSHGLVCDVTDPAQLQHCLDQIQTLLPNTSLGAVFANAGVIFNHTILRSTPAEWQTTLNVNVLGVVNTIQAFVPTLREQGTPSIVCNTASIGGLVRGDVGSAAYQASKHAVVAISESLSFELARSADHIHVHVLCPCIVESALGATSKTNAAVNRGADNALSVQPKEISNQGLQGLAMTCEDHAQQVFDHIASGHFYLVTENVRPYVDHDFPFDAQGIIRERMENMLNLNLDNADAFLEGPGLRTSILKGPMWQELKRRNKTS